LKSSYFDPSTLRHLPALDHAAAYHGHDYDVIITICIQEEVRRVQTRDEASFRRRARERVPLVRAMVMNVFY
jgi:hypothetical protein